MGVPPKAFWLATLLVGMLFAGCSSPSTELSSGHSSLTRHIVVSIDSTSTPPVGSSSPDEMLSHFAHTTFQYKHAGADLKVADVTVRYQTLAGVETSSPLSKFTSKRTLTAGQTVNIAPSDLGIFSSLVLEKGSTTVASRLGVDKDWLKAAGVPLPVASSKSGKVTWDLKATSDMGLTFTDLSFPGAMHCTSSGCTHSTDTIDSVNLDFNLDVDGKVQVQTTAGSPEKVAFSVPSFTENVKVGAKVKGNVEGEALDMDLDATADLSLSGELDLFFDALELTKVGSKGQFKLDTHVTGTGIPGGQSIPDQHEDHSQPYTEQPLQLPHTTDASIAAFLQRMWALDLVVGDAFDFEASAPGFGHLTYNSQVVGSESREVGATSRPTFRITDSFSVSFDTPAAGELRDLKYDFTYWVDQASYLPVYEQGTVSQTIKAADFPQLLATLKTAMESSGARGVNLPDDLTLTLSTDASMQMTAYTGDYTHAGILTTGAARTIPLAAVVFVLVNNLGKSNDFGSPSSHAPHIGFASDQAAHSLTVASAETVSWSAIRAQFTGTGCKASLNGGAPVTSGTLGTTMVTANDKIVVSRTGAGSCTLSLTHTPTSTAYGTWTFSF